MDGKVRHKSLTDGMERRMSLMELRRMGHHTKSLGLSEMEHHKKSLGLRMTVRHMKSLGLHKSSMERILRGLKLRVSRTERLGVL